MVINRRKIVLDAKQQILRAITLDMSSDIFENIIDEAIEKSLNSQNINKIQ